MSYFEVFFEAVFFVAFLAAALVVVTGAVDFFVAVFLAGFDMFVLSLSDCEADRTLYPTFKVLITGFIPFFSDRVSAYGRY